MRSKEELRDWALLRRDIITKEQHASWSEDLMNKAYSLASGMKKLQVVHVFLPIENKNEPDTWLLIDSLRDAFPHLIICAPVTQWSDRSMESKVLAEGAALTLDKAGIPIPTSGAVVPPEYIDLIFVPLLAHNSRYHRIGYGQGFYDRYLLRCRPDAMKIGLSFFGPEEFQEDALDVPLDLVLTV